MVGNIDFDQGHSFCYQITVFFPTHFQKQVIRTTYDIYDPTPVADVFLPNAEA